MCVCVGTMGNNKKIYSLLLIIVKKKRFEKHHSTICLPFTLRQSLPQDKPHLMHPPCMRQAQEPSSPKSSQTPLSLSLLRWCGHLPIGWAVPSTPVAASTFGAAPGARLCTWSATTPLSECSSVAEGGSGAGGWTLRCSGQNSQKMKTRRTPCPPPF